MAEIACGKCRWWAPVYDRQHYGNCRLNPPVVVTRGPERLLESVLPQTHRATCCSHWKERADG